MSDIIFLVKSMKSPSSDFTIFNFIQPRNYSTSSSSSFKFRHSFSRNKTTSHFYFNRINRLWNSLLPLDISLSLSAIKCIICDHFWTYFTLNFDPDNLFPYHYLCPCSTCSKLPAMCSLLCNGCLLCLLTFSFWLLA